MLRTRVIPVLLLRNGGLVKTVKFADPKYVGDPLNAVKIFNDKRVDELAILDIRATPEGRGPDWKLLEDVAAEAFMPLAYGGGLRSVDDMRRVFAIGMEKVVVNTAATEDSGLLRRAADVFGSQSVVASIDVRRKLLGRYEVMAACGTRGTGKDPVEWAKEVEARGAGEIVLNAIDRDGTQAGFDAELIRRVSAAVSVPVVALGGAGSLAHLAEAVKAGASAVAAGSLFVFHGKHRAVLISYPEEDALDAAFRA